MDMFKKSEGKQQVSEPDKPLNLTKQDLADVVAAAVRAATQLNPIEQRKFEQELASQERRDKAAVELARIEQETAERKRNSCTHSRQPHEHGQTRWTCVSERTGRVDYWRAVSLSQASYSRLRSLFSYLAVRADGCRIREHPAVRHDGHGSSS